MKFKLNKTIVVAALMGWTLSANAVDTYDLNTNVLSIPYVVVEGANYAATLQNQGDYVFTLGDVTVATDTSGEPDVFDAATGALSLPQVAVGTDTYKVEMHFDGSIFQITAAEVITPVATPAPTPVATPVPTPDPSAAIARGKTSYDSTCAACHTASPKTAFGNVMKGVDWQASRNAITNGIGGMSILTNSDADLQDIAAYLGSL